MKTSNVNAAKNRRKFLAETRSGVCLVLSLVATAFMFAPSARSAERQVLSGHVRADWARLQPTGRLSGTNHLQLAIELPLRNKEALTNLLQEIYDPASPNYHHYLTPAQFTEQFGPKEKDYQAVMAFANANGLKVTTRHPNRVILDVEAPVANIEKALHVRMRSYRHPKENRTFYAPDREPSLDLATPISHISGLNNYALPHPLLGSGTNGTFMGNDFRAAYAPGVTLTGAGQYVGLAALNGFYQSDITAYENQAGLTNIPVVPVLLGGFDGAPSSDEEVPMDIEMAISMAPGLAGVRVYEGYNLVSVINGMATDTNILARQLSCSYFGQAIDFDSPFLEMAAQGQSFFESSGDTGGFTRTSWSPQDNSFVTLVGGTVLTTSGPVGNWTSEMTWPESSGGISSRYSIPSWQTNINMTVNQGSTTMRNCPDVAMTASGISVIYNNGTVTDAGGGTSAAAPLWAGFCALINQQAVASGKPTVGFLNPALYNIGSLELIQSSYFNAFHDINGGNNGLFQAVQGYDLCTGWGTPNGTNLINALLNPEPLVITPTANITFSGGVGGPFNPASQNFSLTNAGITSLNWKVVNLSSSSWFSLSPTNGTLAPGGATNVTSSLNSAANGLGLGNHFAELEFINLNNNDGLFIQVKLNVVSPPSITTQPTNQTLLEGATATFTVGAIASTPLVYQWRYNGNNLTDGGNISGSTNSTLIISNVSPANVGSYSVIVTNVAGSVTSTNATLTIIPSAPLITLQPASQMVDANDNAQFTVAVLGSKPFYYQWTFNGSNLAGATSAVLALANINASQAGSYQVLVSNAYGSTLSSNAMLTVFPHIGLSGNYTNFTFQGDTTYFIAGSVNLQGTTIFEGGTVLKYPESGVGTLNLSGPFICRTTSYRPVIFTSFNDNSVGTTFPGSSGNPGQVPVSFVSVNYSGTTNRLFLHMRFCHGSYGNGALNGDFLTLQDVQFVQCGGAIDLAGGGGNPNNMDAVLENVLFDNCGYCFAPDSGGPCFVVGEHVTVNNCYNQLASGGGSALYFTNSIIANTANYGSGTTGYGANNGFYNSVEFGVNASTNTFYPFQSVGAGNYYLTNGCAYRNAGTTNIDPAVLADIQAKTTYPPVVYSNITIFTTTTWAPQAQRDTDTPDLGYHYDPLDYLCSGIIRSNGVIILTNGAAVGLFGNSGFAFTDRAGAFISQGQPNAMNHVVWYPAVQEQSVKIGGVAIANSPMFNLSDSQYGQATTTLNFRFTDIAMQGQRQPLLDSLAYAYDYTALSFQDCWLRGINLNISVGGDQDYVFIPSVTLQNNRLERSTVNLLNGVYYGFDFPLALSAWNNLFWNSSFTLGYYDRSTNPLWSIKDNLFDGSALSFSGSSDYTNYASISNNAFHNATNAFGGGNNVTVTNLVYATGPLDSWYIGSASPTLTDQGSRSAASAGLYHYTMMTNLVNGMEVAETNTIVDIGYHYVTVDQSGNPIDSNGDGIPDYIEDANGNGVDDPGEPAWSLRIVSQPQGQSAYVGDNVVFSVSAVGAAPLHYQWRFNGVNIAGATSATLTLNPARPEKAGNYSVVVSNTGGSVASGTAILTLNTPSYTVLFDSQTNYTFKGDTTYYIAGWVNLYGTTIFEGGTVVKYSESGGYYCLSLYGPFNCLTAPYRPAVFTSMNDNTVGATISGSSGHPGLVEQGFLSNNYYSATNPPFEHMRFLYGGLGNGAVSDDHFTAEDVQFVNCGWGIDCGGGSLDPNVPDVFLKNVLFVNCGICAAQDGMGQCVVYGEQVTVDNCYYAFTSSGENPPTSGNAYLTNSIFANTPNYGSLMYGVNNGFYNSAEFGVNPVTNTFYPFQSVGAGNYYLANGCSFVDAGTTNANRLGLYHYTTQTNQMKEANSIVDLGFHYVALGANGNPLDSNGDGIPDYIEDANGNGVDDPGETPWSLEIVTQPQSQSVSVGANVTFSVTAAGITPFSYQWQFNGANIAGATSATLTLPNVQLASAGSYSVLVSDAGGSVASTAAVLTVQPPPYVVLINSQTNYTFKGDTTYYIAGWVNLYGTTIFEGGTVVKYSESSGCFLTLCGPFKCLTAPYRPAVFTSMNDNTVGATILGSSGNPGPVGQGFLWNNCYPPQNSLYQYMRFLYGGYSDCVNETTGNGAVYDDYFTAEDVQFVNCGYAIDCGGGSMNPNVTDVFLKNVLFVNCVLCVGPDSSSFQGPCVVRGTQVTVAGCQQFAGGDRADNGGASYAFMTNCIFANTPVYVPAMFGDHNGFYNSTEFGANAYTNTFYPFQSAGAGNYYLTNGGSFFNAGTTNMDPVVLADIRTKTTHAPMIYSHVTISANLTLNPQAQEDTDAPDLGYHYGPIDYLVDDVGVTNATLTLTNGVVIASYNEPGIWLEDGSALVSIGSPLYPNWLVRYSSVQEQPVGLSGMNNGGMDVVPYYTSAMPSGQYQFTRFACLAGGGVHLYDYATASCGNLTVQDCEFWGGTNVLGGANGAVAAVRNSLFARSAINATGSGGMSLSNTLVWGTAVLLNPSGASVWNAYNNDFDSSAISSANLANGYNAYLNCSGRLSPANANDIVTNATLVYQAGPLGAFYQPTNSSLIHMGSTTADQAGLYHYTVTTNEVMEGTNTVSIGYHYVATDTNGIPLYGD